jgi:hypothetical protein
MSKTHGGKGDLRRPLVVSEEEFTNSWDRIFGNGKQLNRPKTIYDVAPKQEGVYWTDDPLTTIEDCKDAPTKG